MPEASLAAPDAERSHPDALIEVDHVVFGYEGGRTILDDVSMSFGRGKVTAILGGSGCGKTTLLRLIGGVYPVRQGEIRFDGQVIDARNLEQLFVLRRRLGMLFQFGALFTDLSVFENVAFPIREHTRLAEDMIHDLVVMKLHAVGLRGAQGLRPSELSGGMGRRIALARAIALDPDLIIYDEPFAGLDPITLNVVCNLIRKLNDALGATSVVVTYDVHEALKLADYLYLLNDGLIVGHGPTHEMVDSSDPFVHQFLHAQPDGPVRFHFPARPFAEDLELVPAAAPT